MKILRAIATTVMAATFASAPASASWSWAQSRAFASQGVKTAASRTRATTAGVATGKSKHKAVRHARPRLVASR